MKNWSIQNIGKTIHTGDVMRYAQIWYRIPMAGGLCLFLAGYQICRNRWIAVFFVGAAVLLFAGSGFFFRQILKPFLFRGGKCLKVLLSLPVFEQSDEEAGRERSSLGNLLYGMGEQRLDELLQEVKKMLEESFDKDRNLTLSQVQAQINALQSQINPHFLYNALEVMRSYAYMAKANQVAEMAEALSTMFRYSVGTAADVCTVAEELESITNYFVIQHYRYDDRFSLELLFDQKDAELMQCRIPRLSVQPIVENAVHHGLERKLGKGKVTIRMVTTQDRLVIRVLDDGVGIAPKQVAELNRIFEIGLSRLAAAPEPGREKNTHIALININQRIKLYFGEEYGLFLSSAQGVGTLVELNLPRQYQPVIKEEKRSGKDYPTGISSNQTAPRVSDSGAALP